jgi:hypothetical protein
MLAHGVAAKTISALAVDLRAAHGLRSTAMGTVDELLSGDEVAARTGLAAPLVTALIPAVSAAPVGAAGFDYSVSPAMRMGPG